MYSRAVRIIWCAAPGECTLMALALLVQGVTPPVSIWLIKSIVDVVTGSQDLRLGTMYVVGWAAASLLGAMARQWSVVVQMELNERVVGYIELLLMRKANSLPDLSAFEEPRFYDDLQLLTRQSSYRPVNLMVTTGMILPNVISSAGLLVLIGSVAWWLAPLLVMGAVPIGYATSYLQSQSWKVMGQNSALARTMRYFAWVVTTLENAKEVRMFGIGPYFERRYEEAFERFRRDARDARLRQTSWPLAASLLSGGASVAAFAWVVSQTLQGRYTAGDVVLVLQSLASAQGSLGSLSSMFALLLGHLLYFDQLFRFLDYRSPMPVRSPGLPVPAKLTKGIELEDVSFRYAGGTLALDGVSLAIQPGERVALVGENGAGKTTLAKLLCRLYDPSFGRILVDGADLRDLDLGEWRSRIGAVFQDFGRYQLTVAENVALGRLDALGNDEAIERAARQAGFDRHASRLPEGYRTQVGAEFGGVELSGGQWQALGIARALVRDAEVLLLDEPTAALDPRAEYELYQHFSELARGRTTLLITHRLASVRMADRILVLRQGRLVEQGTHEELMRLGGEYAELYRMQAEQYDLSFEE